MPEMPILSSVTPDAIHRIYTMADWLWDDHGNQSRVTEFGTVMPTALGTAERAALRTYLATLTPEAMAEVHALQFIGMHSANDLDPAGTFRRVRQQHLETQQSAETEAEKLLLRMPLAKSLVKGLAMISKADDYEPEDVN